MQYSGYQEPEEWKIKSKEVRRSSEGHTKSRSLESACKIIEKGKKVIFGKEINTVTTKCVTKGSSSSIASIEMYGEGVGLVERSIRSISHDGTGSTEIHRFTLDSVQRVNRLTQ